MNELTKIVVDLSKIEKETAKASLEKIGFNILHNSEEIFLLKPKNLDVDPKVLARLDWILSIEQTNQFEGLKRMKKTFSLGGVELGKDFAVIAGPCVVESREQIRTIAGELAARGIKLLRAGTSKIRTSPYSFAGLGVQAVQLLRETADEYGLAVVSELVDTHHAMQAGPYVDCLQVGTRNMHNTGLLREVARQRKPVLLKRGFCSTLEEWQYAGEYLATEGAREVIFCERGIRTFDSSTRFTLDLAGAVLLKQRTGLPVIIDPSHATGTPDLIVPMALAAKAAGLDGIIVEVHPDPIMALSDGAQALDLDGLDQLLNALDRLSMA